MAATRTRVTAGNFCPLLAIIKLCVYLICVFFAINDLVYR